MEAELIDKILKAVKIEDVFPEIRNNNTDYKSVLKVIHPDVCKTAGAEEAFKRINEMIQEWKKGGKEYTDESGAFKFNGYEADYRGDVVSNILIWSTENFEQLKKKYSPHFQSYIPEDIHTEAYQGCKVKFKDRSVCLSKLELSQEHVNWILSRMLEFCVMLHNGGRIHCGLSPENIFIVPETHGIIVSTFYHLTETGKKVGTINGKYKDWYPAELFTNKVATERIDLELVKKIAIYLIGDKSGVGTKLRGKVNDNFLNFVLKSHSNSLEAYDEYRSMLSKTFEKKFYILNI